MRLAEPIRYGCESTSNRYSNDYRILSGRFLWFVRGTFQAAGGYFNRPIQSDAANNNGRDVANTFEQTVGLIGFASISMTNTGGFTSSPSFAKKLAGRHSRPELQARRSVQAMSDNVRHRMSTWFV